MYMVIYDISLISTRIRLIRMTYFSFFVIEILYIIIFSLHIHLLLLTALVDHDTFFFWALYLPLGLAKDQENYRNPRSKLFEEWPKKALYIRSQIHRIHVQIYSSESCLFLFCMCLDHKENVIEREWREKIAFKDFTPTPVAKEHCRCFDWQHLITNWIDSVYVPFSMAQLSGGLIKFTMWASNVLDILTRLLSQWLFLPLDLLNWLLKSIYYFQEAEKLKSKQRFPHCFGVYILWYLKMKGAKVYYKQKQNLTFLFTLLVVFQTSVTGFPGLSHTARSHTIKKQFLLRKWSFETNFSESDLQKSKWHKIRSDALKKKSLIVQKQGAIILMCGMSADVWSLCVFVVCGLYEEVGWWTFQKKRFSDELVYELV